MIDMSDENKLYSCSDVLSRMKTTVSSRKLPMQTVCSAVVTSYLKLVMQAVLDGFIVALPGTFGSLYILKKEVNLERTKYFEKVKENTGKPIRLNMKRIGFKYEFVLNAPVVKKFCYRFVAGYKYRKQLQQILTETDHDYRTNLI